MNLHDENIILVTDIDPLLRIQALKYFANYSELSPIISNYLSDPVDIVRKVCLELISENNLILPSYQIITTLLADIEWTVRIEAIKVLWLLVLSNPLNITSIRNLPLKDDAFLRLCDMVNDNNTKVRIQAIKTLGLFKNVDTDILLQTLDKQKLSSLKVEPKRIESKAILDPGDFEIESEKEFVNVFDAGAYGAFIHGLEDEFRLVRLASIDSICELSFTSRSFMLKSINFLMDMFIDEDDSVRLLSVNAICKIVANKSDGMLKIDNEQVNDSISIIQDSSIPSRLSAYKMIGFIYLIHRMFTMSLEGLDLMREALFKNIKRYPADLVPIYECFASLGRNHAKFIQAQVPKMLNLDSKYLPIHMSILDPLCIFNIT